MALLGYGIIEIFKNLLCVGSIDLSNSLANDGEGRNDLNNSNNTINTVGVLRIEIHGLKFMSLSKPTLFLALENQIYSTCSSSFDYIFQFSDISSELYIFLLDDYNQSQDNSNYVSPSTSAQSSGSFSYLKNPHFLSKVKGQIVLPIHQYISLFRSNTSSMSHTNL